MSAVSLPFPFSHTVPCIEAKPVALFPGSLCRESVGTPVGLPNHGSHLSPIHEEGGRKVETHADGGIGIAPHLQAEVAGMLTRALDAPYQHHSLTQILSLLVEVLGGLGTVILAIYFPCLLEMSVKEPPPL